MPDPFPKSNTTPSAVLARIFAKKLIVNYYPINNLGILTEPVKPFKNKDPEPLIECDLVVA